MKINSGMVGKKVKSICCIREDMDPDLDRVVDFEGDTGGNSNSVATDHGVSPHTR